LLDCYIGAGPGAEPGAGLVVELGSGLIVKDRGMDRGLVLKNATVWSRKEMYAATLKKFTMNAKVYFKSNCPRTPLFESFEQVGFDHCGTYCQISEKYTIWGQTFARNYVLSAHYIALIRAI
jgi:hypothetical protein